VEPIISLEAVGEDRFDGVIEDAGLPDSRPARARIPLSRRTFDLCALALLAPLLALPALIVAIAVLLDSPGPVFFRAKRMGYGGRSFEMLKFRSMRVDNAGHSIAGTGDSRITPVGGFLRAARLDELPQLWNVLRGEMSLVGPRPELQEFVELHSDEYREILTVPPGITGPTQLRYAGLEPHLLSLYADPERHYREHLLPDKVKLDLAYARSRSFAGDLSVLARTLALPLLVPFRGREGTGSGHRRHRRPLPLALVMMTIIALVPVLFLFALGSPR
jgi:lipopolysaccharide/colanic/teichoic acid biosynthesis glycosyltransferase